MAELRERGLDPSLLFDNLDDVLGGGPSLGAASIGPRTLELAVERLYAQVADPGFGLVMGQEAPDTLLHVVGHLMLTCETVLDRFRVFERYAPLFLHGIDWQFEERSSNAVFGFSAPPAGPLASRFIAEWILVFALRVGRQQARLPSAVPVEVRLVHSEPAYALRYGEIFGCAIYFDQPTYSLVFPRNLVERRQPHADPLIAGALRDVADGLYREATGASSFAERVRHHILALPNLAEFDFDAVSRELGVSPRSLRRRLTEEGYSLSGLVEEALCRRAREELRIRDESVDAIAERLGYADTSSFHRAFKRWTGQTPLDYRKSVRGA